MLLDIVPWPLILLVPFTCLLLGTTRQQAALFYANCNQTYFHPGMLCILCLTNYILDNFKHDNKHNPVSNIYDKMMRWGKKSCMCDLSCLPVFFTLTVVLYVFACGREIDISQKSWGHDVWSFGCNLQICIIKTTTGDMKNLCATMAPLLLSWKQAECLLIVTTP